MSVSDGIYLGYLLICNLLVELVAVSASDTRERYKLPIIPVFVPDIIRMWGKKINLLRLLGRSVAVFEVGINNSCNSIILNEFHVRKNTVTVYRHLFAHPPHFTHQ